MKKEVAKLRRNYTKRQLLNAECADSPIDQFDIWFKEAMKADIVEPNAMVLSTISQQKPRSRVVLLKDYAQRGFIFYTNYRSSKGLELAENPNASLNFFWDIQERQIRIEGEVEKLSNEESDRYFASRPRGSQIGAWVSEQSTTITGRKVLDDNLDRLEKKYADVEIIPRPLHWGGYVLRPQLIEFWQGRPNRLHDRLEYVLEEGDWQISRLSP